MLTDPSSDQEVAAIAAMSAARVGAEVVRVVSPTRVSKHGSKSFASELSANADLIVDLTRAGVLGQLPNDTPRVAMWGLTLDELANLRPHRGLARRAERTAERIKSGNKLEMISAGGTDLRIDLKFVGVEAHTGMPSEDRPVAVWPSGRVTATAGEATVNGTVVLMPGDLLVELGHYIGSPVTLTVKADHISEVEGAAGDTDLINHALSTGGTDGFGFASVTIGLAAAEPLRSSEHFLAPFKRPADALDSPGIVTLAFGPNERAGRLGGARVSAAMHSLSVSVDDRALVSDGKLQGDIRPDVYESAENA